MKKDPATKLCAKLPPRQFGTIIKNYDLHEDVLASRMKTVW